MSKPRLKVTFWGTRGSIPTPGPDTVKYGGNTTCVEVDCGAGGCIIFDAGSGIRALGNDILLSGREAGELHIIFTHLHWDHIQGLLFFQPLYSPGRSIHLWCPAGNPIGPEEVLDYQMHNVFFPVKRSDLKSDIKFHKIGLGSTNIGDAVVTACRNNHPGQVHTYAVEYGGAKVVLATDREPSPSTDHKADMSKPLIELARGADLLIHDGQYTDEEYGSLRRGWGHSPFSEALRVARSAGVRELAMFHHDPSARDEELDRAEAEMQKRLNDGEELKIFFAREGESRAY